MMKIPTPLSFVDFLQCPPFTGLQQKCARCVHIFHGQLTEQFSGSQAFGTFFRVIGSRLKAGKSFLERASGKISAWKMFFSWSKQIIYLIISTKRQPKIQNLPEKRARTAVFVKKIDLRSIRTPLHYPPPRVGNGISFRKNSAE